MKKYILSFAVLLTALSCFNGSKESGSSAEEEQEQIVYPYGFDPASYEAVDGRVKYGETFPHMFIRFGLDAARAQQLTNMCQSSGAFDMRKLRADNRVTAFYSVDSQMTVSPASEPASSEPASSEPISSKPSPSASTPSTHTPTSKKLEYFVYHNDRIRSTVFDLRDSMMVYTCERPTIHERKVADVTINSSLWNDMIAQGSSPLLIAELADIYAWTVNFFGLQKGDRFRVIYSQTVCPVGEVRIVGGVHKFDSTEVVAVDSVFYAVYNSGPFQSIAVRFDQGDCGNKYWNEKGESMRKAFLKAPLKYNRISSRFSYHRKHPVTGKVRAHTAVDYAAPKGTPVHSIGDGTVLKSQWDPKGGGNFIKIRHMNGYETAYLHLSGFAKGIRAGVRVAQGQLIGYVGSTGTSTGPHLDFRVWKDGKPVDPLKMIAPPSEPLKKENIDSLGVLVKRYAAELEGAAAGE